MRLRRGKWVGAALLLYAAIVQYNDPDALPWILVYLSASVLSAVSALRPLPRVLPLLVAAVAFVWMATILPDVFRERSFTATEIERESFGLLIAGVWMLVVAKHPRP